MIDASVCFKKQVKSNVVSLFWIIVAMLITWWPMIIVFVWMFLLPPALNNIELNKKMNNCMCAFIIVVICNGLWGVIIAIPFIRCYMESSEV